MHTWQATHVLQHQHDCAHCDTVTSPSSVAASSSAACTPTPHYLAQACAPVYFLHPLDPALIRRSDMVAPSNQADSARRGNSTDKEMHTWRDAVERLRAGCPQLVASHAQAPALSEEEAAFSATAHRVPTAMHTPPVATELIQRLFSLTSRVHDGHHDASSWPRPVAPQAAFGRHYKLLQYCSWKLDRDNSSSSIRSSPMTLY